MTIKTNKETNQFPIDWIKKTVKQPQNKKQTKKWKWIISKNKNNWKIIKILT